MRERRSGFRLVDDNGPGRGVDSHHLAMALIVAALCSTNLAPLLAQESSRRAFTLSGARVLLPDGTLADGLAVVVSEDRIQRVTDAREEGLPRVRKLAPTSVVSPGLIDLGSALGSYQQNVESARAVDPAATARTAVDPFHRDLRVALEAGITAAMVCPTPRNVVSGSAVTFSTAPTREAKGELDVLRDDGPLVFALRPAVLRRDAAPTSRDGARHLLREALAAARAGGGHARLRSFVEGRIPGLVFCDSSPDLRAAFEVFDEVGRLPHFAHNPDGPLGSARAFAGAVAGRKVLAVIGPFDFTTGEPLLRAGGILDRAGVKVAFRGGLPVASRHALRATAYLAVRHGMDPAAARRALTLHAAEVAGVADRIGAVAARRDADLVVFSADPLRLDARVLEVYVRGVRYFSAVVNP